MHSPYDDTGWSKIQHAGNIGDIMNEITVQKFGFGVRVTHWLNAVLMIGFLITGYGFYTGSYYFGDYSTNLALHILIAFSILMNGFAHLYFMAVTGESRSIWMSRQDFKDIKIIIKNFFGFSKKYPIYGTYNSKTNRFYGKYHPVFKLKYWGDAWFLGFAAISGFALYYPFVFNYLNTFLSYIDAGINLIWLRAAHHLITFVYFFCVFIFHVYISLIPVNFKNLKAMINGKENIEIIK